MAIKAKASSQGAGEFKKFIGVGSFRVVGVNPNKEELEKFYGREVANEPKYLEEKEDANDGNKKYKRLRVSYMVVADLQYEDGKPIKENAALEEPFKTTVNFFIDSRFFYNNDKTKVQVIDKYGRTAWVTVEQFNNKQIPVYKNGPAKIDKDYRACRRGEAELTQFILNYLNVTPIDTYNTNTGQWITNPHPEDCEATLDKVESYFKGDISELKEHCTLMPTNRVKLCVGVRKDNEGREFNTVYTRMTLRNGSNSYTRLRDDISGQQNNDTVYTDDNAGNITNIHEYKVDVKETNFESTEDDPFKAAAALPEDDLPFGDASDEDPFKDAV